jgi:hypothetical protein
VQHCGPRCSVRGASVAPDLAAHHATRSSVEGSRVWRYPCAEDGHPSLPARPRRAASQVTLELSGFEGNANIEVLDYPGQYCSSYTGPVAVNSTGALAYTLNCTIAIGDELPPLLTFNATAANNQTVYATLYFDDQWGGDRDSLFPDDTVQLPRAVIVGNPVQVPSQMTPGDNTSPIYFQVGRPPLHPRVSTASRISAPLLKV